MKIASPIVGVGLDVVEMAQMRSARFKQRLAEYFLTPEEIQAVPQGQKEVEHLASRFALKEAVIKAFPNTLKPHDFMIVKNNKKPDIVFTRREHTNYTALVSLTHTKHIAAAIAIVSCSTK